MMARLKLSAAIAALLVLGACAETNPQQRFVAAGGGGGDTYVDGWGERPDLVTPDGSVVVADDEVATDNPPTADDDFGFDGDGPPSIDSWGEAS